MNYRCERFPSERCRTIFGFETRTQTDRLNLTADIQRIQDRCGACKSAGCQIENLRQQVERELDIIVAKSRGLGR